MSKKRYQKFANAIDRIRNKEDKKMPVKLDETCCRFTPDPGTVVGPVHCGVCNTVMNEVLDTEGYRGFAAAMGKILSRYDSFTCPHMKEDWHNQVIALRDAARKTHSPTLAAIFVKDAEAALATRECTKKGSPW